MSREIRREIEIAAAPETVYTALIRPSMLNQWLCNHSEVSYRAREGGYYYMAWNGTYQVTGSFIALEPGKRVVMTWQGAGEPHPTQVEYTLEKTDGGTRVVMRHTGYQEGEASQTIMQNHERGWEGMLEGLKYFIETGLDQRRMRRPMLGVFLTDVNAQVAERLGLPVTSGILVDGTAKDGAAEKAGIRKGDVIVSLNHQPIKGYGDVEPAIRGKAGGDVVSVTFYRGGEQHQVMMELGKRPIPEIPPTTAELARHMLETYDALMEEVEEILEDVPEATLKDCAEENSWSVNDNLAHLVWAERYLQMDLWNIYGGGFGVDWPDNNVTQLAGILAVYPTSVDLLAALKSAFTETVAMLKILPPETADVKSIFARLAQTALAMPDHTREHIEQIKDTLTRLAAKKAEA